MPKQLLGQDYWGGVCGFVSVLHGILISKKDSDGLDGLDQDELEWNLGQSMLAFLNYVKVSKPAVAKEIVDFTQSFGGVHATKTISTLILECETAVNSLKNGITKKTKETEAGWGIGMPKGALMEYIKWIGARATEVPHNGQWTQENLRGFKNSVCGVGDKDTKDNGFLGLRHWVYINEAGEMYNWGGKTAMGDTPARPYKRDNHNYLVHVLKMG